MRVRPLIYSFPEEVTQFVLSQTTKTRLIVPGPKEADILRSHFPREFFERGIDPETMSSFIKKSLGRISSDLVVKKKSILIQELSSVWNQKYNSEDELFFQCFKYLTEFRGYTLDQNIFLELEGKLNSDVFEGVFFLWNYLEAAEIVDEQRAYSYIAENNELLSDARFIFWGFSNVNSMQIDAFNELATCNEVFIPIHYKSCERIKRSDWPLWLFSMETLVEAKNIYSELYLENKDLVKRINVPVVEFNKNRLGDALNGVNQEVKKQLYFPGADKSFWLKNETHFGEANFQESISIEETEVNEVLRVIEGVNNLGQAQECIENEIKKIFKKKDKNYKKVRILSSLLFYINSWEETTGFSFEFSSLNRKVLKQVMSLDAPRLSIVVNKDISRSISNSYFDKDIMLSKLSRDGICIVYKKDFSPLKKGNVGHSSEVQAFLATLGPLLNNDFEYETCTAQLEEYLESFTRKVMLVEGGLLDSDIDLKNLFDKFDIELEAPMADARSFVRPQKNSLSLDFNRPISSSSLQRYLDCPKNYYLHYGEKRRDYLDLRHTFLARYKGSLEHQIIENYSSEEKAFDEGLLWDLSREVISRDLSQKQVTLDLPDHKNLELEVIKFSENGIKFIIELTEAYENSQVTLEKEIKNKSFFGAADLIVEGDDWFGVVDFKRSTFGVPSKKSVFEFEDIQVPAYAGNYHSISNKKLRFFGYFCLKEPFKSMMIASKEDKDILSSFQSTKFSFIEESEINDFLTREMEFESELVKSIHSDTSFASHPSNSSACSFCHYHLVCNRGQP